MEKIWLENYPPDVPAEIPINPDENLVTMLEHSFRSYRDRPSFSCMGRTLSYGQIDEMSAAFGAWLQKESGLAPGARVAIMLPNVLQYPVALFGALRAGMVVVNVNPLYTPRELEHQLKDSQAEAIVVLENFAATLEKVIRETPVKRVIVTGMGDLLGGPRSMVVNFVVRRLKKLVPPYSLPGHQRLADVLQAGGGMELSPFHPRHEDVAFLQYTGGTTGPSKGAMLTQGSVYANVLQMAALIDPYIRQGEEIVITALPLYHIYALVVNCMCFVRIGGHNVLITNPRDLQGFIKELSRWDFTAFFGVNTLYNSLLHEPGFSRLDFSHLKLAGGGGMAIQSAVATRWHELTGQLLQEGYGLTECSPVVCFNLKSQKEVYTGSVGVPVPSTEISIRDESGQEVPIGESGELCVRGPQVMKGYWGREDATAEVFYPDGFLRTGDIATVDEKGYVRIVDRAKDMILVSGFNVYPCEVEDVVTRHPGVLEAACIGIPDERSGERVKIFVVPKPGKTATAEDIVAYCREHLTGYKVPREVEFRDELPKTNVGKILRRALRES
ncbi:MAG: AMP-binding protein [Gammaproteobacteria bacterium]|nr:MAG: long-chain fatty acid--CoA ligase [Gammaproteobacteria bacterium SG8_31]